MSLFSTLLAIVFVFMLIACVLFVVFGQITVRKLRKNPKTKDTLGVELASGWDIINVAQALAFPRSWLKRIENSPLGFMEADANIVRENTNKVDDALGFIFYWLLMGSAFSAVLLIILNSWGFLGE